MFRSYGSMQSVGALSPDSVGLGALSEGILADKYYNFSFYSYSSKQDERLAAF